MECGQELYTLSRSPISVHLFQDKLLKKIQDMGGIIQVYNNTIQKK